MIATARKRDLRRTIALVERLPVLPDATDRSKDASSSSERRSTGRLGIMLYQSGLSIHPITLIAASIVCASSFAFISTRLLSFYFAPFYFVLGAAVPFIAVERSCRRRAADFAEDYPTVLLAAASSIKVGLTPYQALERATKLLPAKSLVRIEVRSLLDRVRSGVSREQAVKRFADSVRQPDLELFRSALVLVLENGGRFSPTLSRLATVSNNRAQLIRSAGVSTASMRMTANILLCIAPFLTFLLALRTENYWEIFFTHPAANFLASAGIVLITSCYALLRHLSNFKP